MNRTNDNIAKILIVEDELIVARDIRKMLERNGYKVAGISRSAEEALLLIKEQKPAFVLVDIFLKGNLTGIDLATQLHKDNIPFIFISANSNQPVLEAAKTTQPYGFIVKPFREKDLLVTIDIAQYRFASNQQMQQASVATEGNISGAPKKALKKDGSPCESIIGKTAVMMHVFNLVSQVASFDTSVLILGESGTGKEGIANYIVDQSKRKEKPFVKINCGAIPAGLIEAELFGYEKGAFTGASERKAGKFEIANGGTILLDEIGEMPIDMQSKLLRVLQEKEIQRIGSSTTIKIDVRVIAATSRNLEKEVAEGRFRLDLYYRLNVFPILLPPLRERKEDIPLLVDHFIQYYAKKTGKNIKGIDQKGSDDFMNYAWPGNVRELQHLIERSVLLTTDYLIHHINVAENPSTTEIVAIADSKKELDKEQILTVLKQTNFKIAGKEGAAVLLNISPDILRAKIKKFGITKTYE